MQKEDFLVEVSNPATIKEGSLLVRVGNGKHQQGLFAGYDAEGGIVLHHVLNVADCSYIGDAGVLVLSPGDVLFRHAHNFRTSPVKSSALQIVMAWSLFVKNNDLQEDMLNFVRAAYSPEQILHCKHTDSLQLLFVPLQQKFQIGKYQASMEPARIALTAFFSRLESLRKGDHVTYIAHVGPQKTDAPMFYSAGTKPHQETHIRLRKEPFGFAPTHGGHIKMVGETNGNKTFLVDAGSNYIGRGVKTPLHSAEQVVDGLYRVTRGYIFIPVEGRGAFGSQQSY
mgnify:CR=1 FL=1